MTQTIDERLLADFSSLEPVYVDGVLGVVNLETISRRCITGWSR